MAALRQQAVALAGLAPLHAAGAVVVELVGAVASGIAALFLSQPTQEAVAGSLVLRALEARE